MLYYGETTKSITKQGNEDDNEARTDPAETLESVSGFIERSGSGRTGQRVAGSISSDDIAAAADRNHGRKIQQKGDLQWKTRNFYAVLQRPK